MSSLSEEILLILNNKSPYRSHHELLLQAKQEAGAYRTFFADRSESSFKQFGDLNLEGLDILDIGCGLGANLAFLCDLGARSVTGLDISEAQLQRTKCIFGESHPKFAAKVQFVTSDAARMPFPDNHFDVLVAADTFEHIFDLREALEESSRVLKPNGVLYAYFPPFYAPWGAHMVNWINLPWCQIPFSEKTILKVARRLEAEGKAANRYLPDETRLSLGDGEVIPFVNHITLRHFKTIVSTIPDLKIDQEKLLPPNWRTQDRISNTLDVITKIPYIQEAFTAKAMYILRKEKR